MSFDGAYCNSGSGVGIVLKILNLVINHHTIRIKFPCMNNEVEYEALIQGMNLAIQTKIEHLIIYDDFELVINHIMKKYKIKKRVINTLDAKRVNE
jgi:ribonuclease HI